MAAIQLGSYDPGKLPSNLQSFLSPYHPKNGAFAKVQNKLRDDDNNKFIKWKEGENVQKLQEFLFNAGFMTKKYNEGVFDYVTEAGVRLFQEYVRTIEPGDLSFYRDGKVGKLTWDKIHEWPDGKKCEWHPSRASESSTHLEYNNWFDLLDDVHKHYEITENQGPIMRTVNAMTDTKSTKKVSEWNFDRDKIHLIGIRRNESVVTKIRNKELRTNDDLFVLLINGMVFKFWGSTDPRVYYPDYTKGKKDEAFLVEGQHIFSFGWHGYSPQKNGIYTTYRALRPAIQDRIVVLRDKTRDNIMSTDDLIKKGLDYGEAINIHWSGKNRSSDTTWSMGCQVIRGDSYINNRNEAIDLTEFTANNYEELYNHDDLDKGAYNMLADLVVCYSEPNLEGKNPEGSQLLYTLGNEKETLPIIKTMFGENYVIRALIDMGADDPSFARN